MNITCFSNEVSLGKKKKKEGLESHLAPDERPAPHKELRAA